MMWEFIRLALQNDLSIYCPDCSSSDTHSTTGSWSNIDSLNTNIYCTNCGSVFKLREALMQVGDVAGRRA